jgi:hypothetical protein
LNASNPLQQNKAKLDEALRLLITEFQENGHTEHLEALNENASVVQETTWDVLSGLITKEYYFDH